MTISERASGKPPINLKSVSYGDFTWVDIDQPTEEVMNHLAETYHFNQLDLEDVMSPAQMPKIEEYDDYLFIVFSISVYNRKTRISSRKQWSAFLGQNFLVSVRPPELKVAAEIFRECESRSETREQYLTHGSGFLLYQLLDKAIDRYFRILDKIVRSMESIEDNVFKEETETATELSLLRRDIINQRQVMFPTRILLGDLETKLKPFSKTDLTLFFSDLMDHINKICDTLDEIRDMIEVLKDTDYLLSGYRTNRTIRAMAVLLSVGLPVVVGTSIYLLLPPSIDKSAPGSLAALLLVVIVLIVITLVTLRRRRLI
jgi:magnesium transporter